MAGCFGNSDYDRWLERQVDEYCSEDVDDDYDVDDYYDEE
jgi:hypothetical protein